MGRRVGAIDPRVLQRQRHEAFAGELAERQPMRLNQRCVFAVVRERAIAAAGRDQMLVEVAHRVLEPDVSTR